MPKLSEAVLNIKINTAQAIADAKIMAEQVKVSMLQTKAAILDLNLASKEAAVGQGTLGKQAGFLGSGVLRNIVAFAGYYRAIALVNGVIASAVSELKNFDAQLRDIQSITQESDGSIQMLGKDLLGLVLSGQLAGTSASEAARSIYLLVSAGYSTDESLKLVQVAAEGAAAGLSDTYTTSQLLIGILQAYQLPVSSATAVMNTLFAGVTSGVLHFKDFTSSLGLVIPTAAALNIPLNQIVAAVDTLTLQGQTASRAITNLNAVLTAFLKPNKDLAGVIDHLGYSSGEAMIRMLGVPGALKAIEAAASDNSVAVAADANATDKLRIAQQESNVASEEAALRLRDTKAALDSLTESQQMAQEDNSMRVRSAKLALDDLTKAQHNAHYKTSADREKAQLEMDQATLAYKRAQDAVTKADQSAQSERDHATLAYKKAQDDVVKANQTATDSADKYNKSLGTLAKDSVPDADAALAKMFPNVRAIRGVFGLATEGGELYDKVLNKITEDEQKNAAAAALASQKKGLSYELGQLSANAKALFTVLMGFAGSSIQGPLTSIVTSLNTLFAKLGHFEEVIGPDGTVTKHWHFFWENNAKLMNTAKTVMIGIIAFIVGMLIPLIVTAIGWVASFIAGLGAFALISNPFSLIILGIILLLQHTGHLGEAWNIVKTVVKAAIKEITKDVSEFIHFFTLGLEGGGMGGQHSFFEKLAFGIGDAIRKVIPVVKDFVNEVIKLGHLLVLGFAGGQIAGEYSKIEKAAFAAGQIIHQILNWVKDKAVPWAITTIVDNVNNAVKFFGILKGMLEDIGRSPSFRSFIAFMKENLPILVGQIGYFVGKVIEFTKSPVGSFLLGLVDKVAKFILVLGLLQNPTVQSIAFFWLLVKAVDFAVVIFHKIADAAKDFWKELKGFVDMITAIPGDIIDAFKDLVSKFKEQFNNLNDALTSSLDVGKIIKAGISIGKSLIDGIIEGISGISGKVGDISTAIYDAIKKGLNAALLKAHNTLHLSLGKIGIGKAAVDLGSFTFPLVQFASGVRDWMGGMAMLGEHGPEMAFLPSGTSVAPAMQTSRIMDNLSHGGGWTGDANFYVTAPTVDEIMKQLHGQVDSLGRNLRYRAQRSGSLLTGQIG